MHHGKFFTEPPTPFYCLGFLFDRQLAYLSDVSFIPPEIYARIADYVALPARRRASGRKALTNGTHGSAPQEEEEEGREEEKPRLKALVVDCLRVEPFASHFGMGQAVETARKLGADRTYLVRSPSLIRPKGLFCRAVTHSHRHPRRSSASATAPLTSSGSP